MTRKSKLGMTFGLALISAFPLCAQVLNSTASTITLNAVLSQSVRVTLSANAVNFNLTAGSASNLGSTSITATTTWTLKPSVGSLKVYAFFANSASALNDGAGDNIPSADFQISNNGAAFNELSNPAKGRVEYVNDSLTPLNVVLEHKSFSVSETGATRYRPLDVGRRL